MRSSLGIAIAAAALVLGALVQPSGADDVTIATRLSKEFVAPRYADLARAASAQSEAWRSFCADPSEQGLDTVREAYRAAADRWSSVELVKYGPVSEDFRAERMSFWPERKNATGRGLARLLAGTAPEELAPERIREASAAVQGLPALERLLFDDPPSDSAGFGGSVEGKRRCAAGQAIALNVAGLAAEIRDGWPEAERKLAEPDAAKEGLRRLATDLLAAFQVMRDVNVLPVLGTDPSKARSRLAEGWRSGRSTRAIVLNIEAAEAMAGILLNGDKESNALYAIRQARQIAEALPPDFASLARDAKERHRLVLLFDALGSARDSLMADLPAALGIGFGFNSLDGD